MTGGLFTFISRWSAGLPVFRQQTGRASGKYLMVSPGFTGWRIQDEGRFLHTFKSFLNKYFKIFSQVESEVPLLFSPASSECPGERRAGRSEYRQTGGGWRLVEASGDLATIPSLAITCQAGCHLSLARQFSQTPWRDLAGHGDPWSIQVKHNTSL